MLSQKDATVLLPMVSPETGKMAYIRRSDVTVICGHITISK